MLQTTRNYCSKPVEEKTTQTKLLHACCYMRAALVHSACVTHFQTESDVSPLILARALFFTNRAHSFK